MFFYFDFYRLLLVLVPFGPSHFSLRDTCSHFGRNVLVGARTRGLFLFLSYIDIYIYLSIFKTLLTPLTLSIILCHFADVVHIWLTSYACRRFFCLFEKYVLVVIYGLSKFAPDEFEIFDELF